MGYDMATQTRETLRAYLQTEFDTRTTSGALPGPVVVLADWPEPNAVLPERAVSLVIPDDAPPEVRYWPPAEFDLLPNPSDLSGNTGLTRYTYGQFKLAIQLDVWTRYADARSALVKVLNDVLFRHPNETLHNDTWPRLHYWPELALNEPALPGCVLFYRFEDIAVPTQSSNAAQEGEYRVAVRGLVEGYFTAEETVAIMRHLEIDLTQNIAGGTAPADDPETITVT